MKLLYAEDEKTLSNAVVEILKMEQYEVDAVYDGMEALNHLRAAHYDAVVLDIMMPKMDGVQVLETMRQEQNFTPVLLLTAKSSTEDRIEGLSTGADDYLTKPFEIGELLARITAMIRRATQYEMPELCCGNVTLNCSTNELISTGGSLRLSSRETKLLSLFLTHRETVFDRKTIEEWLWQGETNDPAVDLYISYLRNKLGQIRADIELEETPEGYVLKKRAC